uniref:Uncharacterized protein n=1 Tax=Arundo donax TaxID=35708 RepID=A0A0A9DQN4_ARUDO
MGRRVRPLQPSGSRQRTMHQPMRTRKYMHRFLHPPGSRISRRLTRADRFRSEGTELMSYREMLHGGEPLVLICFVSRLARKVLF